MRVFSMLEDYRIMCAEAEQKGKFVSYQLYTSRYPVLFEAVLQYLYLCPLEALRDYIETIDLTSLLHQGEENKCTGLFSQTVDIVADCSAQMGIDFPFDLYLGMELGNIGGASLPSGNGNRFVYIGMDRKIDREWLRVFVPHELNHLLRIHHTGEQESTTLFARMISEGLASYCPLWFRNLPWSTETVAKSLGVKTEHAQYMMEHASQIVTNLWSKGDIPLDSEIMSQYFTANHTGNSVQIPGYFVGMFLVYQLVSHGKDYMNLTKTSTSDILVMIRNEDLVKNCNRATGESR